MKIVKAIKTNSYSYALASSVLLSYEILDRIIAEEMWNFLNFNFFAHTKSQPLRCIIKWEDHFWVAKNHKCVKCVFSVSILNCFLIEL